jgi:hypothetical protein
VTVSFPSGVQAAVDGYRLESGDRGMSRSGFLRGWELIGRVRGSWISLDKHEGTDILGDVREHQFTLGASWGVVVDAIRLCQLGRNGIGGSLMQLRGFELMGDWWVWLKLSGRIAHRQEQIPPVR